MSTALEPVVGCPRVSQHTRAPLTRAVCMVLHAQKERGGHSSSGAAAETTVAPVLSASQVADAVRGFRVRLVDTIRSRFWVVLNAAKAGGAHSRRLDITRLAEGRSVFILEDVPAHRSFNLAVRCLRFGAA